MADQVCGGWTETRDADEKIQKISDEVKGQAEQKTGKKYEEFHALQYRSQLVTGTNYLIKVHVGENNYLHLLVWQQLPCDGGKFILTNVEEHHHKDDPLVPF